MTTNHIQIDRDGCIIEDVSYFDAQVYLDAFSTANTELAAYAFPVELSVLMPTAWDFEEVDKRVSPQDYFKAAETADKIELLGSLRPIGSSPLAESYLAVQLGLQRVSKADLRPVPVAETKPLGAAPLSISPLKLYFYADSYARNSVDDPEAADRFTLALDKIGLLALLPLIFHQGVMSQALSEVADPTKAEAALTFIGRLAELLLLQKGASSINTLSSPRVVGSTYTIQLTSNEWRQLLKSATSTHASNQVLFPLEFLEEKVKQSLEAAFKDSLTSLTEEQTGKLRSISEAAGLAPLSYRILYNLIEIVHTRWEVGPYNRDINFYKLQYRQPPELLPVIEELDVRPPLWMREAASLSIEKFIAQTRQAKAVTALQGASDPTGMNSAAEELRQASKALFQVDESIEVLRDELGEPGFKLYETAGTPPKLEIKQEVSQVRTVYIPRTTITTWTERIAERECFLFFCRTNYRYRTHVNVRNWVEWHTFTETLRAPVSVEWRPMDEFLHGEQGGLLPSRTFESRGEDGALDAEGSKRNQTLLYRALGKPADAKLKRGDKDVREFTLHDNGYRDQYGVSLERVLASCDNPTTRAKTLLMLPIHERRVDGQLAIVKYLAVHNPIAPRPTLVEPRVFLVETYRHSLSQLPGHWIGPISHTVCLFPGETRKLRLVSETRIVTQQKQENRSSQRSALEQRTSVRHQVRRDLEDIRKDSKSNNWSANASGGVNFKFVNFGGGASGGGSSQTSQESISKELSDRVSESLVAASDNNEVQFLSASESSQTQSSSSEQVVEFQNVNLGRAVTHKFFQVLHKFESSVSLHDARLVVEYGEPLIPGLNIFKTEVKRLDQIDELFPELTSESRTNALTKLKELVERRLADSARRPAAHVSQLEFVPRPLATTVSWANSGAYFLESEVSAMPAVENYIGAIRDAEVDLQKSRAERVRAEAEAIRKGSLVLPDTQNMTVTLRTHPDRSEETPIEKD